MKLVKKTIWILVGVTSACNSPTSFTEQTEEVAESAQVEESWAEDAATQLTELSDTLYLDQPGVVFFMPNALDLEQWASDASTLEGLESAVGDFAYNASIMADSLTNRGIDVQFTDRNFILYNQQGKDHLISRDHSSALMGISMSDGDNNPKTIFGLQTPSSWWNELEDYYFAEPTAVTPLLQHFKSLTPKRLHIYTSHGEILNQTGAKINPQWHPTLSKKLANRARKFRMSFFGYYQFSLGDSMVALICRVPSISDESAINLFVWDQRQKTVVAELPLAENIWSDGLIRVKDSWIVPGERPNEYRFIQRQREARFKNGKRVEEDQMSLWVWNGGQLKAQSSNNLVKTRYPLKDWASFHEPKIQPKPNHFTFVDDEFAWLPLATGDMTYENIILELQKPYELQKEPIANQYQQSQIDTIFTLSRPATTFRFYGTPEDHILISGTTEELGLTFKKGIQIGMPKSSFGAVFPKLQNKDFIPDEIRITSKNGDRIIKCYFQSDTLAKLEITHYIH